MCDPYGMFFGPEDEYEPDPWASVCVAVVLALALAVVLVGVCWQIGTYIF